MAHILSIDASTTGCSVAVFENENLLASSESRTERSSAEYLTTMIDHVMEMGRLPFSELDAIAVAKGPGSYTGLRIAVSTAKGLAFSLDKPLISYNTLEGLVNQIIDFETDTNLYCPMIDARRMEVYCAFFDKKGKQVLETTAEIVDENSFSEILNQNIVTFLGEGSHKIAGFLNHPNARYLKIPVQPSAKYSGKICYENYVNGKFESLVDFEPYYLKEYMFKTKKP